MIQLELFCPRDAWLLDRRFCAATQAFYIQFRGNTLPSRALYQVIAKQLLHATQSTLLTASNSTL